MGSIRESKWPGDFQNGNPNGWGIFKMEIQTGNFQNGNPNGGFSKWKSKWDQYGINTGSIRDQYGSIRDQDGINPGSIRD